MDWYNWRCVELECLRKVYIKIGWCKEHNDNLKNYEDFVLSVKKMSKKKKAFIKYIIINTKGLKRFMSIHSVFGINDNKEGDWFVKYIISLLKVTDEEVKAVHKKDKLPKEIITTFSVFNPEPIGFEKYLHDVELYYKLWGSWKKKEQTNPIKILDRKWESIGKKFTNDEIDKILSEFECIKCS